MSLLYCDNPYMMWLYLIDLGSKLRLEMNPYFIRLSRARPLEAICFTDKLFVANCLDSPLDPAAK